MIRYHISCSLSEGDGKRREGKRGTRRDGKKQVGTGGNGGSETPHESSISQNTVSTHLNALLTDTSV